MDATLVLLKQKLIQFHPQIVGFAGWYLGKQGLTIILHILPWARQNFLDEIDWGYKGFYHLLYRHSTRYLSVNM